MNLVNPVLGRELKERMRGFRSPFVLTAYLALMGVVVYVVYAEQTGERTNPLGGADATSSALIGRGIFEWIGFFMLVLVLFIVPGLTASAITGERERQTLLPLQVTLMRPRSIVIGKVGAAAAFVVLLVVATAPMLALSYLIGGVSIRDVVQYIGLVVVSALAMAGISVAISCFSKRVVTATVLSYGVVLLLALGSFVAYAAAEAIDESRGTDETNPPERLLIASPLAAAADLLGPARSGLQRQPSSPFNPIRDLIDSTDDESTNSGVIVPGPFPVPAPGASTATSAFEDEDGSGLAFWIECLIALTALAVAAMAAGSRRLRTPAKSER